MEDGKSVHALVLDAGPIIKNDPAISTLMNKAGKLYTVPAIISELKDAQTRSRVQTTLQPFLTIQSPNPKSVKIIADFARRTGDYAVLSKPDIEIIALTYDLECERNQGNWRLRSVPGQKKLNGSPPSRSAANGIEGQNHDVSASAKDALPQLTANLSLEDAADLVKSTKLEEIQDDPSRAAHAQLQHSSEEAPVRHNNSNLASEFAVEAPPSDLRAEIDHSPSIITDEGVQDESDSDSDGWITPSNLKRQQAKDSGASTLDNAEPAVMQAAVLTSDFAMQNVILQMNLNLLSPSLQRVRHLKTFVLRCHACFQTTKDMTKQFCPKCGQAALTRVSCSTNANGEFKLHLKKNMQWNTRGDRFSVPKPAHGSANGRVRGGGKGGWGHDLILAEDQKEYERARVVERKQKERSLMDDDYLPSILTGARSREGGRIKVGAGKNVNSRKR